MKCLFCKIFDKKEKGFIYDNNGFYSFLDPNPVNKGHALIIPKRHLNSLIGLTNEEQNDFFDALREVKKFIDKKYHPDGYNIGINDGKAAGQTIMHLHVHLIPRYEGDVPNPKGGIRNVILGKGDYTKKN